MPYLFAGTLFVSAALLFIVEPMIAKMVLPLLGGSAAVWNTCLVFFQAALLGGYLYAHALGTWLSFRLQVVVHTALLCLALALLPIGLPDWLVGRLPHDASPVAWLLALLAVAVGLPFVVVAASAPLLQKWYAGGQGAGARDPYFLYAASNLGSMLALGSYPFLLEPKATLGEQSWLWAGGYGLLVLLTIACAAAVRFSSAPSVRQEQSAVEKADESSTQRNDGPEEGVQIGTSSLRPGPGHSKAGEKNDAIGRSLELPVTTGRRLRWVVLAFAPSSLLLGVTTYVTTDLAAVPLLWVVPLALYLLSFIIVFSRKPILPHDWMVYLLPVVALVAAFTQLRMALPTWQLIPVHWLALFVAALVCHGELALDRPPTRYLTEFYLWIAVGGMLGGLFNALLAPLLFQGSALEYPLALLLACFLRPGPRLRDSTSLARWLDLLVPVGIGVLALGLMVLARSFEDELGRRGRVIAFGVIAVLCFLCGGRPIRFALALGAAMLMLAAGAPGAGRTLYAERNFFGLIRVQEDRDKTFHLLYHGSTLHGLQRQESVPVRLLPLMGHDPLTVAALTDAARIWRLEPLSYFHRDGPVGQVLGEFDRRQDLPLRVAVTGLGVGALASYARPNEEWTFYEIDPAMERVARDRKFFTFLADSQAARLDVELGDARLRLQEAPDHSFGLMVLDAFSSDAVPTHLLSREALQLYNAKRAKSGLLVFNITNRYLDLEPVLARLAEDAGLVAFARQESVTEEDVDAGHFPSHWVVMADRAEDLGDLPRDGRWQRLSSRPGTRLWTDDFVNLLQVFRWKR